MRSSLNARGDVAVYLLQKWYERMSRKNRNSTLGTLVEGNGEPARAAEKPRRRKRDEQWSLLPTPEQWDAWKHYLAGRPRTADLVKLADHPDTHPLKWAVPDSYDALPAPRLLKRLTRWATRKELSGATVTRTLEDWLADAQRSKSDAVWALESIAWCHLVPRLATVVPEDVWRALYEMLHKAVQSAAGIAVHDDPVRHQLLNAELPLAMAFALPELQPCRDLVLPASRALSFALVELLDGEGLVCAAHLEYFRSLLACWTRCSLMNGAALWNCMDQDGRIQFEWMVRQALRLTRPDGTLVLSRGLSGDWCPDLLHTALSQGGGRKDRVLAHLILPDRRVKKGHRRARKLPPPSVYSEWGEVCAMRAAWSRKSPQFVCLFGDERLWSEVTTAGRTLWSGDVAPHVTVDGQLLEHRSAWTESCWYTDKDVDYLELEVDCHDGWQIQRQMLLARKDRFLLLADVILGPQRAAIHYDVRLPLADDIRCAWEGETREGLLSNDRALSAVVPLSLPEWKLAPAHGTLQSDGNALHLTIAETAQRLYAPLLFDLVTRRVRERRTWRQLTVAEELLHRSRDVAVGYRVQLGYAQWLIYRSLTPRCSRSVLGQNVTDEFVAARFDLDGGLDELLEIE